MKTVPQRGDYEAPRYYGKFKSFVRKNDDPESRGRLRLYCPQVMGKEDNPEHWLGWAEPCFPWYGGVDGSVFGVPPTREQQGDGSRDRIGVWVEFEDGNPDFPIWCGVFVVAPTKAEGTIPATDVVSFGTGSLVKNPPSGSDLAELDELQFQSSDFLHTLALLAKRGKDIVIASKDGGSILIGPSGVHIRGVAFSVNGRHIISSSQKKGF